MNLADQPMKLVKFIGLFAIAANAAAGTVDVPPAPLYRDMPLPSGGDVQRSSFGDLSWIDSEPVSGTPGSKTDCWQWGLVQRQWNPATGKTSKRPPGSRGSISRASEM